MSTAIVPVIKVNESVILPDNTQWTNRFEIRSETSRRIYIIAQNKSNRGWGCSCMGWIRNRNCKHLKALGLPPLLQPYEAKLQIK